ncbi:hypothetical protein GGR54DRAFT_624253 [Hypoxylon sp. NC1633]|nr:hypothetical protein GGR54DRAFT_624253 [Hypoxylon sp. NC1633]
MRNGLADSKWSPSGAYRVNKPRGRSLHRTAGLPSLPTTPTPATKSASVPQHHSLSTEVSNTPSPQRKPSGLHPSSQQELSRFLKIVARLNWKLPFLKQGYSVAQDAAGKQEHQVQACEIQFKLDFHEFYMLLERALVHLLSVYGIAVDGKPRVHGGSGGKGFGQHHYHANVLAALKDPNNPLHPIFEADDVRYQLYRAKDLRNLWKNADDESEAFKPPPLKVYDLEELVPTILGALERAHSLAAEHVRKTEGEPMKSAKEPANEEDNWEFMLDAMDWEAV